MKFLDAILAGIAGTAAMTAFLYLLSYATHRVMKVVKVLGTMLLFRTQPDGSLSDALSTRVVGTIAHYSIGAFFAVVYLALWDADVGLISFSWSLLFGLANGITGMFGWYFLFLVHPRPPIIRLKTYLLTLLFAHLIFAFVTFFTYYNIVLPDYTFWQ